MANTVALALPAPQIVFDPSYGIAGTTGNVGTVVLPWPRLRLAAAGDGASLNQPSVVLTWLTPGVAAAGITGITGVVSLALSPHLAGSGASGAIGAVSLALPTPGVRAFAPNMAALALPAPGLAIAGGAGVIGRVALAAPAPALQITGLVPAVNAVALTLAPRIAIAGASGAGAVLALALPAPRITIAGGAGVNGFVALSLAAPRLAVSGYAPVRGTLQLAAPRPQLVIMGRESAGATFATITINTETMAVATYDNYPFNGFARFNGVTLGSSAAGVFVLDGDLDDGAPIAARIQLGKLDFSTSHMKRVDRCYVGYRASGDLALQVGVDDGAPLTYALAANGVTALHGARVVLAKGVTGRYWQFALTNTGGAAFSLDALEATPETLARRVRSA